VDGPPGALRVAADASDLGGALNRTESSPSRPGPRDHDVLDRRSVDADTFENKL
jgi:hypothetical protein